MLLRWGLFCAGELGLCRPTGQWRYHWALKLVSSPTLLCAAADCAGVAVGYFLLQVEPDATEHHRCWRRVGAGAHLRRSRRDEPAESLEVKVAQVVPCTSCGVGTVAGDGRKRGSGKSAVGEGFGVHVRQAFGVLFGGCVSRRARATSQFVSGTSISVRLIRLTVVRWRTCCGCRRMHM